MNSNLRASIMAMWSIHFISKDNKMVFNKIFNRVFNE